MYAFKEVCKYLHISMSELLIMYYVYVMYIFVRGKVCHSCYVMANWHAWFEEAAYLDV